MLNPLYTYILNILFGLVWFYGISNFVGNLMLNPLYTYIISIYHLVWFGLVWFYAMSTFVGYLMPNPLYTYEVHTISFQTFFVWALLLIVHTWSSSPLRRNLPRLQCSCCTVPTTSGRPLGSPLVWACQWPSSQPLSSPQLSHNDSLWARE